MICLKGSGSCWMMRNKKSTACTCISTKKILPQDGEGAFLEGSRSMLGVWLWLRQELGQDGTDQSVSARDTGTDDGDARWVWLVRGRQSQGDPRSGSAQDATTDIGREALARSTQV